MEEILMNRSLGILEGEVKI